MIFSNCAFICVTLADSFVAFVFNFMFRPIGVYCNVYLQLCGFEFLCQLPGTVHAILFHLPLAVTLFLHQSVIFFDFVSFI